MIVFELAPHFIEAVGLGLDAEDLRCGFERGILSAAGVVDLATAEVRRGAAGDVLHALARLLRDEVDQVPEVFRALDSPERMHYSRESVRKWLYLQLKAAYCERDHLSDPLGVIESIYADFGYPSSMHSFVRFMPPRPGDPVDKPALMDRWAAFLNREHDTLGSN